MLRVATKDWITSRLAEEFAYRQCEADWWYYHMKNQDVSSLVLDYVSEIHDVARRLEVDIEEIVRRALEIYDFSNSGKASFVPDLDYIQTMMDYFSEKFLDD